MEATLWGILVCISLRPPSLGNRRSYRRCWPVEGKEVDVRTFTSNLIVAVKPNNFLLLGLRLPAHNSPVTRVWARRLVW